MRPATLTALIASLVTAPALAGDISLSLPIDCTIGEDCRIQQYVDRDPGPGFEDFACGGLSYDGHKGTDFALETLQEMRRGVAVLAAADGVVVGLRDGMEDRTYSPDHDEEIGGRDCGNGVLLRHADGWETQYCHLRNGSVRLRKGDTVRRGDVLGLVGLSGRTQFPHVHLTLRKDGAVVDPFVPDMDRACGPAETTLWQEPLAYAPGGLIQAAFAPGLPTYDAVRAGTAGHDTLPAQAKALVVYAYAFGGREGDRIALRIDGPDGVVFDQSVTLDKDQALFFRAGGKRLRGEGWPTGAYTGMVRMLRDGVELDRLITAVQIE